MESKHYNIKTKDRTWPHPALILMQNHVTSKNLRTISEVMQHSRLISYILFYTNCLKVFPYYVLLNNSLQWLTKFFWMSTIMGSGPRGLLLHLVPSKRLKYILNEIWQGKIIDEGPHLFATVPQKNPIDMNKVLNLCA